MAKPVAGIAPSSSHRSWRPGFSQVEFAERIDVSLDTIRNWEQGKRCPTGAAKALLKVLDKA
ncbi:MAG: helix-turn-helix domain-containing protein, partial [Betaproteobacteria bacterium]|nr:helix-turn-helix domain-containing protein [Betaproteobacteria bacterium]